VYSKYRSTLFQTAAPLRRFAHRTVVGGCRRRRQGAGCRKSFFYGTRGQEGSAANRSGRTARILKGHSGLSYVAAPKPSTWIHESAAESAAGIPGMAPIGGVRQRRIGSRRCFGVDAAQSFRGPTCPGTTSDSGCPEQRLCPIGAGTIHGCIITPVARRLHSGPVLLARRHRRTPRSVSFLVRPSATVDQGVACAIFEFGASKSIGDWGFAMLVGVDLLKGVESHTWSAAAPIAIPRGWLHPARFKTRHYGRKSVSGV